jgi:hypothetical protein
MRLFRSFLVILWWSIVRDSPAFNQASRPTLLGVTPNLFGGKSVKDYGQVYIYSITAPSPISYSEAWLGCGRSVRICVVVKARANGID